MYVGSVKVWDQRQKNDPVAKMEPAEGEIRRDCWAVAFGKSPLDTTSLVDKPFFMNTYSLYKIP